MARLSWEARVLLSCALAGACIGGALVARGADDSFTLHVTGPDGAPVARARASFEPAEVTAADGRYVDVAVVDGQAVFPLPPQRGDLLVWGASTAGGEPRDLGPQARRIDRPVASVEIRLEAGKAIEGRVLDEAGKAVANVKVTATGTTPEWSVRDLPHGVASTDARGAFRIQGLADIPYILDADAAGRYAQPPSKGAHPGRGEVTIVLRKGIVTTITVVDGSGRPVPGAKVELSRNRGREFHEPEPLGEERTGADGTVRFRGVDPYAVCRLAVDAPASRKDLISSIQWEWTPSDQTVRLGGAFTLRGTVHDAKGAPFAAEVWVRSSQGTVMSHSTADGKFVVDGLPHEPVAVAAFRTADEAFKEKGNWVTVTPDRPEVALVIRSPEPPGLVLDGIGGGRTVLFLREGRSEPVLETSTDAGGRVSRVDRLPARGPYDLWVPPAGPVDDASLYLRGLTLSDTEDVRLAVPSQPPVRVVVTGALDAALVEVYALMPGGKVLSPEKRDDGTFLFHGIPPGEWTVDAKAKGKSSWLRGSAKLSGQASVEILLAPR